MIRVTNSTPGLLAEELESNMPEVEYSTVVTPVLLVRQIVALYW
jgi:hypothetical protein